MVQAPPRLPIPQLPLTALAIAASNRSGEVRSGGKIDLCPPRAVVNLAGGTAGLPGSLPNFALFTGGPGTRGQFGAILISKRPVSGHRIGGFARNCIPSSRKRAAAAGRRLQPRYLATFGWSAANKKLDSNSADQAKRLISGRVILANLA